jgi:hypothetical protein
VEIHVWPFDGEPFTPQDAGLTCLRSLETLSNRPVFAPWKNAYDASVMFLFERKKLVESHSLFKVTNLG